MIILLLYYLSDLGRVKCWKLLPASQGRTEQDCKYRFTCVLDPGLIKGAWTKEEDKKVVHTKLQLQLGLEVKYGVGFKEH